MGAMSRFRALAALLILIWIIELVNFLTGHALNHFGLLPRHWSGLPGIVLAPLLHGNFTHLFSNTSGLLALGGLVAMQGERYYITVTLAIVLFSGILVWLFGRPALHIGASGLVFGYFGLLLGRAWYTRTLTAILIGAVVIALYGSLLWGLNPLQKFVSWEGHLAGLVAGLAVASLYKKRRANGTV
ncbi:MAG: rhomboid family intramembrane serine protease [Gammaproteobacteria bacterium]|nr:rhomboid family intramembrane serine protease [Gammaproteobacteria bacterium]